MRVPIEGGAIERLASLPNGSSQLTGLALTNTHVVFIRGPKEIEGNSTIAAVPLDGGKLTVLAEAKGTADALVVDERNAYFADLEGVEAVPLTGGATRTLVSGILPWSLEITDNTLYFGDERNLYAVSLEGGNPAILAPGVGFALTSCGDSICWISGTGLMGTLMRLDPGGEPVTVADDLAKPIDLVFDGEDYFVAGARGYIARVPADGGKARFIYGEPGMSDLALEGECLFWSSAETITSVSISAARKIGADD
jgi:hypothetical protein